jgi:hypothetical protein
MSQRYLGQVRPSGQDTIDPQRWVEVAAGTMQDAALAVLAKQGWPPGSDTCEVMVAPEDGPRHDSGVPLVCHGFEIRKRPKQ